MPCVASGMDLIVIPPSSEKRLSFAVTVFCDL